VVNSSWFNSTSCSTGTVLNQHYVLTQHVVLN
jgi:hypothetical protein